MEEEKTIEEINNDLQVDESRDSNQFDTSFTSSPKVEKVSVPVSGMSFFEALEKIKKGKKIHKLEWEDKEFYAVLKDGIAYLHKPDGNFYQWVLSEADFNLDDWIATD